MGLFDWFKKKEEPCSCSACNEPKLAKKKAAKKKKR